MDRASLQRLPELLWFTPRERQVLQEICSRRSNKEIGVSLGISPNGVRNIVTKLLQKLDGVMDRHDLMRWCLQHPHDLVRGCTRDRRLHSDPCSCGSPGCILLGQLLRPAA